MNYHHYYSDSNKTPAHTFRVQIHGYLLPVDDEVIFNQNLIIRAVNWDEACLIAGLIRDKRLNRLYTTTTVADLYGHSSATWSAGPGEPELPQPFEHDVMEYRTIIIREPGTCPLTGTVSDYAEEHFTIHATSRQQAHRIAGFVSTLPFNGSVRQTIINGEKHADERY